MTEFQIRTKIGKLQDATLDFFDAVDETDKFEIALNRQEVLQHLHNIVTEAFESLLESWKE